ncbi:MAG: hypothetical protein J6Y89_10960, partial [Lachnospiraceae bacterium]|nr:hypothetical protein [Lachnospiraceae bacterium]
MKKRVITVCLILAAAVVCGVLLFTRNNAEYVEKPDETEVASAFELLSEAVGGSVMYCDWLEATGVLGSSSSDSYGEGEYTGSPIYMGSTVTDGSAGTGTAGTTTEGNKTAAGGTGLVIDYGETARYHVNVSKAGLYAIKLKYRPAGSTMSDFAVSMQINGKQDYHEMKIIALPQLWSDETKDYLKDSYGDEMAPKQIRFDGEQERYLYSGTYSSDEPLMFRLDAGDNEILFTNVAADGLELGTMTVERPIDEPIDYIDYIASYEGTADVPKEIITINAIDYTAKNSTQAIYMTEDDPAVSPYDVHNKKLNSVKFTEAGTELIYELNIPESGLYALSLHYTNEKEEYDSFESIYIDGEIPFAELKSYAFAPTGTTWTNETLSDAQGKPYLVYLSAGKHELKLKEEQEKVYTAWRYARLISEHVSQFSLDISKIIGADKDKYRTWKMTKYIPEIPDYLDAYVTLIQYIRYLTQDNATYGINSALLSDMDKALIFIRQMRKYPDEIALYTEKLTGRDNSVLVAMSNFTSQILTSKFTIDAIYAGGAEAELPRVSASFGTKFATGAKKLFLSFTENKYSTKDVDEDTVTIWVNRAVTHVDLLQKMIDTDFTVKTGIKAKVSIMPDANKLTLAAAADETPDVALGLSSFMPFDLACRDALYDMTQFDDFWEIAGRFIPGAFVPYVFNEGVYAIPETLNFYALV